MLTATPVFSDKSIMRGLALIICVFICMPCFASYRVYKLKILHYNAFGQIKRSEVVLSHLDAFQYEHYYAGYRWDKVILLDTWYCPGDTSRKKYCSKPKVSEVSYVDEKEKRIELPYSRAPVIP